MDNEGGCFGRLILLVTLFTGFLSYMFTNVSIEPQLDEVVYAFELVGDVEYSFMETINCQYVIEGNIEYLDAETIDYKNLVVKIQNISNFDERPLGNLWVGNNPALGESEWDVLLKGTYVYVVWIHDLTDDVPLSPRVSIDAFDCANNRIRAQVNFRQVRDFD